MWDVIATGGMAHVIPAHDEFQHEAATDCWCEPIETEPELWTHRDRLRREGPADPDHE